MKNKNIKSFGEFNENLNISDVMFSFYESKYGMLPDDNYYTEEELIIKSFEAEFGDRPTTIKERIKFTDELSKEMGISKDFILKVIGNRN